PSMHAPFKSLLYILAASVIPAVAATNAAPANPLLVESPLPLNFPQFDRIRTEHYLPAIEAGMADQRKRGDAIGTDPAKPTFENTIVALERSGTMLDRVLAVFQNQTSANTSPELQAVQRTVSPKLAVHHDAILLDPRLFARIDALYTQRDKLGLDP